MRKLIVSLALSSVCGLGLAMAAPQAAPQSQDQPGPAQNHRWNGHRDADPNKQVEHLTKKLKLTADQQNQILPILTSRQQQMESIRNDSSLSPQDRRAKFQSIREDSDTKIRAVLNDDQKKNYDQMQQEMRDRRQNRQQGAAQ